MNDTLQALYQPQNPHPYYQQMREQQPVFYDQGQQVWQVFRYAEVSRVFTDHQTFSSRTPCCPFTMDFHSFHRMDPPELQRYRSLVSQPFTPLAASRLAGRIKSLATELLDGIADRGQMDIIDDLAFPLPLRVMADLLGLPLGDEERYAALSKDILNGEPGEEKPELRAYLLDLLTERRPALRPGMITSLLEARLDGRHLRQEEVLGLCGQVFAGANLEITPFLGNVVQSLIEHPEVADELHAEPDLIAGAIEDLDPQGAVLSLRLPSRETSAFNAQETICSYGHFFVDQEHASTWPGLHPEAVLLFIEDAVHLASALANAARRYAEKTRV